MKQNYEELFRRLSKVRAPLGLHQSVIARIDEARLRIMRIKFALFSAFGFASGVALFALVSSTSAKMLESGFIDYASLLFSDSGAVLSYWREFSVTLVESLPLLGLTLILLALLTMLQTFRLAAKNSGAFFTHQFI
ncbi:MAG: hypothetical protein A2845_01030 [Candidatus Lloydbacteria bacterium RIFCSPHIGHO2_01_FULL_49_22]|uniref:Uncharacterized protein n=1 Tax=Candidatus Lloydbacteria bacterium RIFCSPHIGHO2_01_FULL_49_22 TaxID=1798658 RepID=A0A1G2CYA2_9BACT|nr:MAG: hypothetical protein A2845_01030 [Candidatus Lloydbacteria bacterium RIFCSPHIGHO2_01_FULL_49_22]OGZ09930.1 MAG: hypothetical protein A3C14_04400 [Candidatus Lloydbacteria bacterium RIFCSPHIGHO2_02_FULL_50_18]